MYHKHTNMSSPNPSISSINRAAGPVGPFTKPTASSGGWLETHQDIQKEVEEEHNIYVNQVFGGISIRTALVVYLVMTLVVLIYESVYIILYFVGVIPDTILIAANSPGISEGQRAYYMDLEDKQKPWLIAQLTWYVFGILFSLFGFFAFFMRSLELFKVFQFWLFGHVFAYFVGAIIFEQISPIALEVPGYFLLSMIFALSNVYAAYLSTEYRERLTSIESRKTCNSGVPEIKEIASPV